MEIKVAVIGPEDIVARVVGLAEEFPGVQFLPLSYASESETADLTRKGEEGADVIVFTGPVPYYLALAAGKPSRPCLFVRYTTAGLLTTLLQMVTQHGTDIRRLSVDTMSQAAIAEVYAELGIPPDEIYTKEYEGPIEAAELVSFHTELWQRGKTNAALTCLRSAYRRLQEKGVPVFRISPPRSAFRDTLQLAVLEGQAVRSKETQIAVALLNIDQFRSRVRKSNSQYEVQRLKLALHKIALDWGEEIQASVVFLGGDEFLIFTTRGILERYTGHYNRIPLLGQIRSELFLTASLGIGLGRTAVEAENHARNALTQAKANGGDCCYVAFDDGRIRGPLGHAEQMTYALRSEDERIVQLAHMTNLSVVTISRLLSALDKLGKPTVTANELAAALAITMRSARRLLGALEEKKLAHVVGEEQPVVRGRPRKVYQLKLS